MRQLLLPALLACAVPGLSGCQKAMDAAASTAIARAGGDPREVDGTRIRTGHSDDAAPPPVHGVALPVDFPEDLFLPGEYGVTSVMDMGRTRIVNLTAAGAMSPLFESTRASMRDQGWQQTLAVQQADSALLGFAKEGREVAYSFAPAAERGKVAMALQVLAARQ
jgi:hypothetical protein